MFRCPVCFEAYGPREERYARVLGPCGHDVCERCMKALVRRRCPRCPACRRLLFEDADTQRVLAARGDLLEPLLAERFPRLYTLSNFAEPHRRRLDDGIEELRQRYFLETLPLTALGNELLRRLDLANHLRTRWRQISQEQKTQAFALFFQGLPLLFLTVWAVSRYLQA